MNTTIQIFIGKVYRLGCPNRSEILRTFEESLLSTINATRDPAEETLANIAPTIATRLDGISRQTAPLMTMLNSLECQLSRVVGFMGNVGANARSIFGPGADAEPTPWGALPNGDRASAYRMSRTLVTVTDAILEWTAAFILASSTTATQEIAEKSVGTALNNACYSDVSDYVCDLVRLTMLSSFIYDFYMLFF